MQDKKENLKFVPLKTKVLLAVLPLVALFAAFCFIAVVRSERQFGQHGAENQAAALAAAVGALGSDTLTSSPVKPAALTSLRNDLKALASQSSLEYAAIIKHDGTILAHTDPQKIGQKANDDATQFALKISTPKQSLAKHDNRVFVEASHPLGKKGQHLGVAMVGWSLANWEQMQKQTSRYLLGLTLIIVAGILVFAALLTYYYSNPLLIVAKSAKDIVNGHFDSQLVSNRSDEVGLVNAGVNQLAERLQTALSEAESSRQYTQTRVRELRDFADAVMSGDLQGQARVQDLDEIGQLAMTINEMVRHMRGLIEEERLHRAQLETSANVIKELSDQVAAKGNAASRATAPPQSDVDTVISMGAATPRPKAATVPPSVPAAAVNQVPRLMRQENPETAGADSDYAGDGGYDYNLSNSGELNRSQKAYVDKLSLLGAGQTALIATQGTEDTYPFLRHVLESEGFSVVQASNTGEMLDMGTVIGPQLVIVEFNELANGNLSAVNKLRSTRQCAKTSIIVLEANKNAYSQYNSFNDVITIIIPNSDDELAQMLREALAEILLIGGANPFVSRSRRRKPHTFGHGR